MALDSGLRSRTLFRKLPASLSLSSYLNPVVKTFLQVLAYDTETAPVPATQSAATPAAVCALPSASLRPPPTARVTAP